MVSGINGSDAMQQMQQMHHMRQGQGNGEGQGMGKGHGMGQLMQSLPQDERENLQNTLKSMDETQRKDVVSQLKELDVANLSQDELTSQIQNILNPNQSANSMASDYNFLTYA